MQCSVRPSRGPNTLPVLVGAYQATEACHHFPKVLGPRKGSPADMWPLHSSTRISIPSYHVFLCWSFYPFHLILMKSYPCGRSGVC
jgi:hypothetical protein